MNNIDIFDPDGIWDLSDKIISSWWKPTEYFLIDNYSQKALKKLESYQTLWVFLGIYIVFSPVSISAIMIEYMSFYEKVKPLKPLIISAGISWQIIWIFWLINTGKLQLKVNKAKKILKNIKE